MEPRESLGPGAACGWKHTYLEAAEELRARTGGSREGCLEQVFQQLHLQDGSPGGKSTEGQEALCRDDLSG